MSDSVGRIDLDLGINYGSFNRELNSISNNAANMVGGTFKKLGGIIAAAFAVKAMIDFGKGAIELASNLNEVQNVVDVTFGSMSNQVNNFAGNALNSFGLSELSAKKFSSAIGAMMKSSGISGQSLVNMSEGITGLTGDMASFYNLNQDDAFTKIQAGLAGEIMPLRQLGINMSVANMEAYALSQGIKTSYQNMSQAEQTLLRYNYLLSVAKDAQGDFARTSNSWANQTRLLTEQWKIFQGTMGQGFINMLTPVLQGLNALISKLQVAAQYFKAFTEVVFGNAQATSTTSKTSTSAISQQVYQTQALTSANDGLATATTKAGKTAKGALAGFDQLNTLNKQAADSSVPGATSMPTVSVPKIDTSKIKTSLQPLLDTFDKLLTPLRNINFEPLIAAFGRLKTAVQPFTNKLFEGLRWAYTEVFVPLASWTVSNFLPAFLDLLSGAFNLLNPLLDAFKPLGLWLWNDFLVPIATFTGGVIVSVLEDLAGALTKVGTWISNNQGPVQGMAITVAGFFAAWKVVELMSFIETSGGVISALSGITTAIWTATGAKVADKLETMALQLMYAGDFIASIAKATGEVIVSTGKWILNTAAVVANKAGLVAMAVAQGIMNVAMGAWNVICAIGTGVTKAFGVAVGILTSPIGLVVLAIAGLVTGIVLLIKNWDTVKKVAGEAWNDIKKIWGSASAWFSSNVTSPIGNLFKGMINAVVDCINTVINSINAIQIPEITIMGKTVFDGWKGASLKKIPHLANGGLVSAPTLAMVGDNKGAYNDPEVVSPLSKLQSMMGNNNNDEIVSLLKSILAALKSNNNELVLKIGETEFGRTAIKAINNAQRQAGLTLLTV